MTGFANTENRYRVEPGGTEYGFTVQASPTKAEDVDPTSGDVTGAWWALYIGTSGDVKVDMSGSGTVTFKNVPVGWLPISCTKVYRTGTDAADIIGMTG